MLNKMDRRKVQSKGILETILKSDDRSRKEKKLKFGCGFGLNFVGGTSLSLAPNLMYKVSEKM